MTGTGGLFLRAGALFVLAPFVAAAPASALTAVQQCGQQYQSAKAAGTLNGMSWNQFRADCTAKSKAEPASATATSVAEPVPAPAAVTAPVTNPLKPAGLAAGPAPAPSPTVAAAPAGKPASAGRTAMLTRERQCGAEWKAQKASLVTQTPGMTWPKYWSSCNTRLKAAGQ